MHKKLLLHCFMNAGFLNVYLSFEIKILFRKVCVIWKAAILFTISCASNLFYFFFFFTILGIVERKIYAVYYRVDLFCIFCNLGGDNLDCLSFPQWDVKILNVSWKWFPFCLEIMSMSALHCKMQQNSTFQCLLLSECRENNRRGWICRRKC